MKQKKTIVVHSGGMDSSLCLALAVKEFAAENVLSLSFKYDQRHQQEIQQAQKIAKHFQVDNIVLEINCLSQITENALTNKSLKIEHKKGESPNTLVVGRNGLMARIAGIHAHSLGANCIYMGIMELESANSGYRDCSRHYMNIIEQALRLDFAKDNFEIRTPLVSMTKKETMILGYQLGVLGFLLEETITCYEGIPKEGCGKCPACQLRNQGLKEFSIEYPSFTIPYSL